MKPRLFDGTKWIEFETEAEHDAYVETLRLPDFKNEREDVVKNIEIGKNIALEYLVDNSKIDLTTEQSIQQLQKFQYIKALLEVGALDAAKDLIISTETDEVFTKERKEKYLLMFQK